MSDFFLSLYVSLPKGKKSRRMISAASQGYWQTSVRFISQPDSFYFFLTGSDSSITARFKCFLVQVFRQCTGSQLHEQSDKQAGIHIEPPGFTVNHAGHAHQTSRLVEFVVTRFADGATFGIQHFSGISASL